MAADTSDAVPGATPGPHEHEKRQELRREDRGDRSAAPQLTPDIARQRETTGMHPRQFYDIEVCAGPQPTGQPREPHGPAPATGCGAVDVGRASLARAAGMPPDKEMP